MTSRAKSHWENKTAKVLRKLAPSFGVDPKGKKKAELIHEMRAAFWKRHP